MNRPDAVVYDIGNVLIRWDPEGFYDRIMPSDARARMFAEARLHEMNDRVDQGAPFRDTIYAHAAAHPEWADLIRMWHDRWIELASPVIGHSLALLRALRAKGVPVHALSNFGVGSFAYAQTRYPFLMEFDRYFISGHLGVIKPSPVIYAVVETATGLWGDRLLFVDDRRDNIDAAAARGWRTHQFSAPEDWAGRLVAEGLLTESEAMAPA